MKKLFAVSIALAALSTPVLAATEFYVAQDASTKACTVADKKPDGKTHMMRGDKPFASKELAEAALKADKDCKQ